MSLIVQIKINLVINLGRAKKAGIGILVAFNILVIAAAVSSPNPLNIIIAFAILESIIVLPAYAIARYMKRRKIARQLEIPAKKAEPKASHAKSIEHTTEKVKEISDVNQQEVKPVEAPKRVSCSQCGAEFDGRAQFCSICGEKFSSK